MNRGFLSALILAVPMAALLGACVLPTSPRSGAFYIDVVDPRNGAVVPVGTELNVDADATSDRDDISRLDFYADGVWFGGVAGADLYTSSSPGFRTGEAYWTPPAAGEYMLQASAIRRGGLVVSAPTRVCAVDFVIDPGVEQAAYGYEGPCPIPPPDAEARPGAVTLAADATPAAFVYPPLGDLPAGCTPSGTITFQATLVDPPEDVAFVAVFVSLPSGPGTAAAWRSYPSWDSTFVLTQIGAYPGSTRIFSGSADPGPTMDFFGAAGGTITWTAKAIGRDGSILVSDGPHTIPATECASSAPLLLPFTPLPATETAGPTLTPTLTEVPATFTPSAANCPAGTYFAPNSNTCVKILFTPTAKPTKKPPSCKKYSDASSCTSNGCNWDKGTNTCH